MPTIGEILHDARTQLSPKTHVPQIESRILLGTILNKSTAWLFANLDYELSAEEFAAFTRALEQSVSGYPLAYILGRVGFYEWDFSVTPDVLIPRPETELLVDRAKAWATKKHPQGKGLKISDVGTGSGAIGISLALLLPQAQVFATDISEAALNIARLNAQQLNVTVNFSQGDLLAPLSHEKPFHLITANLPYIRTDVLPSLSVSLYEPHVALDGGKDGLILIWKFLQQAPRYLAPGGLMLLEIGADQGKAVCALAERAFPTAEINLFKDYAKFDRVVSIQDRKIA